MKKISLIAGSILVVLAVYLYADTTTLSGFTDTYMVMNRDSTPETQPLLIVEGYHCSACIDQRVLMKFDLAGFAATTIIGKATLKLYSPSQPRPGAATVRVYKVKKNWNAAEANWTNATTSLKWTQPGGDFEVTPGSSLSYNNQVNVWHSYDITEIIQGFTKDPASNFGIMLMMEPTMKTVAYASSEATKTELRPKLHIDYSPGTAVVGQAIERRYAPANFRIVDSRLRFSFTDAGSHRVRIGKLDGTMIFEGMLSGSQPVLPFDGVCPGIYFISVADAAGQMQRTFSIVGP